MAAIEELNPIGSACDVGDVAAATYGPGRTFDWILSSHTCEHLPDPCRFLRQCAAGPTQFRAASRRVSRPALPSVASSASFP